MPAGTEQNVVRGSTGLPVAHQSAGPQHLTRLAVQFGPAALTVAAWLGWLFASGGYFATGWYPVAIGALVLLMIQVVAGRRLLPGSRPARLALALFGAFVAWSFASMSWAISADGAWQASNQLLLYLVIAWIFALTPWTPRSAAILIGAWSMGCALICAAFLIKGLGASELTHYMAGGRWQQPVGYANATSAVAVMAFLPALVLSAHARVPVPVQVAYLMAAAFLTDYALLPQSRGALVGLVVATVVIVVLAPGRLRIIPRLAVLGLVVGLSVQSIYAVFDAAFLAHPVPPVLLHAAGRMLLGVAVALLGAVAIGLVERRVQPSARTVRRVRILLSAGFAVCILAGLSVMVAENARIGHYISRDWHVFSSPVYLPNRPGPRIALINSDQRYDMWRVALRAFGSSPLHGIGSGSFQYRYLVYRRANPYVRQPHDLWLRLLSETGAVGAALFLGVLVVMLGALVWARPRLDRDRSAVVAVAAAVLVYFLVHSTVDWLDVIPAVAAPAFALPLGALAVAYRRPPVDDGRRPRATLQPMRRVGLLAVGVVAVAALLSLVFPYLSSRQLDTALARVRQGGSSALAAARDAARLDPLATLPHDVAGTVALGSGRLVLARREFRRSLSLQNGWYPHLELALLNSQSGNFAAARDEIGRARSLDPLDPFLAQAAKLIGQHHPVNPVRFSADVVDSPLALWGKML